MKALKRIGYIFLFFLVGALMPISIWVAGGAAFRQRNRQAKLTSYTVPMTCAIDADCPPGFVCVNGSCVPARD